MNGEVSSVTDTSNNSVRTYTYDVFGNLKEAVLPAKTISYSVDAHNRRMIRKENGVAVQYYVWNSNNQLIGTMNANGELQSRFIYGSKAHVPDYMSKNNVDYQIVTNHLGSPVAVVDSSTGTVEQEIVYDVWGNILSDSNPGLTPFGFAGCLYDQDTKLCRFGARDYDAGIGRWLSKDPILFAGGDTNLYGYVIQDPVNWIDSDGLSRNRPIMNPADDVLTKPGRGFGGGGGYGRGGQKLAPIGGTSAAHTSFKYGPNGRISSYSTWTPNPLNPSGFDLQKRFDGSGGHGGIQGPHVHEPGGVRPPNACELPGGY